MPKRDDGEPEKAIPRYLRMAFLNAQGGDPAKAAEFLASAIAKGYVPTAKMIRSMRRLGVEVPGDQPSTT